MSKAGKITLAVVLIIVVVVVAAGYALSRHKDTTKAVTPAPSASASVGSSSSPAPTVAGVPRCHTADLSAAVQPDNAAAGTAYYRITFTNHSSQTCTMYGYPGVSLVDKDGQQLGKPATRGGGVAPALLSLAPGAAAHALVGFPAAGNFQAGTCSAASASLQIYPPDETSALLVAMSQPYCPGFSVAAVQTGAN